MKFYEISAGPVDASNECLNKCFQDSLQIRHLCYFCLVLLCFHAHLFVDALWSPAGKGLASWFSFVVSGCDVVTFQLVSWVRCGA